MGHQCRSWHSQGQTLQSKLLMLTPAKPASSNRQSWSSLPPVVQDYFLRTFSLQDDDSAALPLLQTLKMEQKGKFRSKEGESWRSFTAQQVMRGYPAQHAGFLWEAEMALTEGGWPGAIRVRDAWVRGEGLLRASLGCAWTLATEPSQKGNEMGLLQGEMMRWLAEAFLIPTSLLPEAGLVEWKQGADPKQSNKVQLSMMDPYPNDSSGTSSPLQINVDVTFQDDDTIVVEGLRAQADGGRFVNRPWIGILSNFSSFVREGSSVNARPIQLPLHMKAGWKKKDKESDTFYYFIAENHNLHLDWAEILPVTTSSTTQSVKT